MIRFLKTHKHAWAALYLCFYLALFFFTEHLVVEDYYVCHLPLDDLIPFCEWFVIPYVLWFPYLAAVGVYLLSRQDGEEFYRFVFFVLGSMTLCLVICLVFPNGQNLRPEVFPRENLLTKLVGAIYRADTNTNVLPSMHVLASMETHAMVVKSRHPLLQKKWVRRLSLTLTVLISLSTVFIKQHSVLDGLAAIALFFPLYLLNYGFDPIGRLCRRARRKSE